MDASSQLVYVDSLRMKSKIARACSIICILTLLFPLLLIRAVVKQAIFQADFAGISIKVCFVLFWPILPDRRF